MKILYIAHELYLGGATRSLLELIDEMNERGHRIYVLIPAGSGELNRELQKRNVEVIQARFYSWMSSNGFLAKLKLKLKILLNYLCLIKLIPKIKSLGIEIIHTNTSVINIGGILKKKLGIPHLWHIREFGEEDHGLHFANKKKCIKFMADFSDAIIAISKSIYNKYIEHFDEKKMQLAYNGLPSEYIKQKIRKTVPNVVNFLISGSLQEGKGQKEALEALYLLKMKGYNNLKLFIAGRGQEKFKSELLKLIFDQDLGDMAVMVGYVDDMNSLREQMDVELVCSRSEAFGRVTIEAMMSTNPVIATNAGANAELVVDLYNGLLYAQGQPKDLAIKIEYLLNYPQEIVRMGSNAYQYSISNFTSKENANRIEHLYGLLLDHANLND